METACFKFDIINQKERKKKKHKPTSLTVINEHPIPPWLCEIGVLETLCQQWADVLCVSVNGLNSAFLVKTQHS